MKVVGINGFGRIGRSVVRIALERIIPEHKKPKKIEVKDASKQRSQKELLVEDK